MWLAVSRAGKNAAKPPPNIRLKAVLPRDFNEKLAITV